MATTVTGRSIHTITPTGIRLIKQLAADGLPNYIIARKLDVSDYTFRACKKRQPKVEQALKAGRAAFGQTVRKMTSRDGGVRKTRNIRYSDGEWEWLREESKRLNTNRCDMVREDSLVRMKNTNANPRNKT